MGTKRCCVKDCDGFAKSREMCHAHYCRVLRTGDPGGPVSRRRRQGKGRIPDWRRDYTLRSKYGIGVAEYRAMLAAQNGVCAICGRADSGQRYEAFHVDHDHETGKVRGLLCGHCNSGMGLLRDDPDLLVAAAAYLLSHKDLLTTEVSL